MPELSTGVRLGVDARNLVELVGDELIDHLASSFGEQENILLVFQEVGDLFVFLDVGGLQSLLGPQAEVSDILDDLFPLIDQVLALADGLEALLLLVVGEPEGDEGQADDLGHEALDVAVAVSGFLVEADVLVLFEVVVLVEVRHAVRVDQDYWLVFIGLALDDLVDHLGDGRVLYVHDVEAGEVGLVSHFQCVTQMLAVA